MRILRPSAIRLKIVEGREENADMTKMAYLGSDWGDGGDVGAVSGRRYGGEYSRESEAIFKIKYYIGFAVHPLINTEECWTQPVLFAPIEWR